MAEGSKAPSTQDDTAISQNILPNDSFVNLIGRQSKLFEEFGKHQTKVFEEFGKQQTKIFVEFGNKMSIELQTSYQEYLKQQVENTVKAEKNSLQFEKVCRKYEEDIVSLRARIEELESESIIKNQNVDNLLQVTKNLKKDFQLILENNNKQVEFQDVDNENCKVLEIPEIDSILTKDDNCKIPEEEPSLTKDESCKVLEIPELINQLDSSEMLEEFIVKRARRPEKPGILGKEVMLKANFIGVTNFGYPEIYFYSFKFNGITVLSVKGKVIQMKLSELFGPNAFPVYDVSHVYSPTKLAIGHTKQTMNHDITVPGVDGSGRGKTFRVEIKHQGKIILNTIRDYVKNNSRTPWDGRIQSNLSALNAFANNKVLSEYFSVMKAIFPPSCVNNPIYLPGGIEMRYGFFQSIRPGWGRLIINVGTRATTFYPAAPIIDIIPKIFREKHEKSRDDLRQGLDQNEIDFLNWYLKGVRVFVTLRSDYRKQKYRVFRVDRQSADVARFKQGNKEIT
ncbi:5497_t:CDS:2, partial [Funneliformis mosseae]